MKTQEIADVVARQFENSSEIDGALNISKEISLYKYLEPCDLDVAIYQPVLCLILQGKKQMALGSRKLLAGPGQSLIVSHEVPIVSRIEQASRKKPYFAFVLKLDINIIRGLYYDFGTFDQETGTARSLEIAESNPLLLDSLYRLLNAILDPTDSVVLFPQILRETHYRILQSPYGGMLRNLLRYDSHASSITRAISIIRNRYNESLSVQELANLVGMSTSSFHQNFKNVTGTTPLQYQKDLRLIEAQRLLTTEGLSVTSTAFEVGYESPNQFSREYTRKFGFNPVADSRRTGRAV